MRDISRRFFLKALGAIGVGSIGVGQLVATPSKPTDSVRLFDTPEECTKFLVANWESLQGRIVVTAPAWRITKMAAEKMVPHHNIHLWRDIDRCIMARRSGGLRVDFLPAGNGDKVRGRRADLLCIISPNRMGKDVFKQIVLGQTAMSPNKEVLG